MRSTSALRLFSIGGVPVRIDFTWIFAALYLTFIFASQFSRAARAAEVSEGALLLPPLAWGVILMLALFACVLLHELAHVWVARAGGTRVSAITLMMLGGVSEMEPIERPTHERWVSLAGPALSLALALLFWALFRVSGAAPADVRFGFFYLAEVNFVIGVFNLLPAFPMDGGRVLRSLLVPRLGRVRGTQVAATVGKVVAAAMVVLGLMGGGLWLILIAIFIALGGEAEARALAARAVLEGMHVWEVCTRGVVTVDARGSVAQGAAALLANRNEAAVVVDEGRAIGVVTARDLARVPMRERERAPLTQVMQRVPAISMHEDLIGVLKLLDREGSDVAVVAEDGHVVGLLSREELMRAAQLRELVAART